MLPRPGQTPTGSGRLTAAALQALQSLEQLHPGASDLGVLAYYKPVPRNPFQSLLYSACWRERIAPVAIPSPDGLDDLVDVARLGVHLALHLHWTRPITVGASDAHEARERMLAFLDQLDSLRRAGGSFVWTVHNVWPHEVEHPEVETELRRGLVDRADLIHVLTEATVGEAEAAGYALPAERVAHIRHPSYVGVYPARTDIPGVRSRLGLHPTGPVFGAVGAIRPYKRTGALLDAFDHLLAGWSVSRPPQLLVAGSGADEELRDRIAVHPAAVGYFQDLDDATLVDFVRAADVIVLPYRRALNSGALILALSCARPVVAPHVGGLTEVAGAPVVTTFDPSDPADLSRALADAVMLAGDEDVRRQSFQAVAPLDPDAIANAFAHAIRDVWTTPSASD